MFTYLRHTLLMLAVLLGVIGPPGRAPGNNPPEDEPRPATVPATGPCPYRSCEGEGSWQGGFYLCDSCDRDFYYCTDCRVFYTPDKKDHDEHKPAVVS
jgi:hypothetical protein